MCCEFFILLCAIYYSLRRKKCLIISCMSIAGNLYRLCFNSASGLILNRTYGAYTSCIPDTWRVPRNHRPSPPFTI